jgi:hypothetical protein
MNQKLSMLKKCGVEHLRDSVRLATLVEDVMNVAAVAMGSEGPGGIRN